MNALGWFFCEMAFRAWEALPDDADRRWWFAPINPLIVLSYRLGCFFYGRAA